VCGEAVEAATEVLRSGWLTLGPHTAAFEKAFADYVDAPYAVGLNSCTSALQLALRVLDLPADSEVITTPITFVSTNHAILHEQLQPVFADVEPHTGNIDANSIADRITDRTKAIMLVHFGGYPCELDRIYELAGRHKLAVVEDCAHACGSQYRGRPIGSHGELHAFSFHACKNLAIGDAGALTIRCPELDGRLRRLRRFGIDHDAYQRTRPGAYAWDYDVTELGFKSHMSDVQAAIGLAQLQHLDAQNAIRAELVSAYRERLADTPGVELFRYEEDRASSHHLFCILAEDRDGLIDKLREAGVATSVYYRRNDHYRMFEQHDLPNTERFWQRVVTLPLHLAMSTDEVDYITGLIRGGWTSATRHDIAA
jgi:perosamine synthetase